MNHDPIVEEIHKIRETYAKEHNNDLHQICEDIRRQQQQENRKTVTRSPKKPIIQPEVA